ncbi:hypothetical protein KC622_00765 [Candidatus Dojkabacteria bacterium]|uniref:Uncharacterized protein n=1 Tax=Candidatus Dojkabacteria bacterium TaxID=2099670 RepID=A0A955HYF1_9BACT|nr:hypothetical protein [Candidatus Dojkabacteria bacterium]MCB9790982.1 hypothetical protein [Candidatus Nomurabacteria bacterium]
MPEKSIRNKNLVRNVIRGFYLLVLLFSSRALVYADILSDRLNAVGTSTNQVDLVNNVISLAIPIGVFSLIGLMVSAGYIMLTSEGNPEKIAEARSIIVNALIGFGLVGLAVAILLLINNVLQLPGVNP